LGEPQISNQIYSYALIKSLYDEGQDYLDSFWPFAITVIPTNLNVDVNYIQKKVQKKFDLDIPLHVLGILLARAEQEKYIVRDADLKYVLTGQGYDYVNKFENDRNVDRRIGALLDSGKSFLNKKGVVLTTDQVRSLILTFIKKNMDFLIECINPSVVLAKLPDVDGNDKHLLEYLQVINEQEPDNYKTLENMVMGSIISALLYVETPDDITKIKAPFSCQVYLDTNFIFSVLGLHMKEFCEPAEELFKLLKANNFETKVFSFTVDEMAALLSNYDNVYDKYPRTIRIQSLFSALKFKGWTKSDVKNFIANLDRSLEQAGITIEWIKGVNLKNYKADEELRDEISNYKPDQPPYSQNHDLLAIEKIKEIRGNPARRIEDSKAIFLSSDAKLSRYNFESEHKQAGTICEIILDRLFTNILWLKNPNTKLPLRSIIAAHSRQLFVNRRVWDRFFNVLQKLKASGEVNEEAIATLFWHNYLEDALKSIDEVDADKISEQFVLDEIEIIKHKKENIEKQRDEENSKKKQELEQTIQQIDSDHKAKEKELLENLDRARKEKIETETESMVRIEEIKNKLRKKAEKEAKLWTRVCLISAFLSFTILAIYFGVQLQYLSLLFSIIGISGISGLWKFAGKRTTWLTNRIYHKKLKDAGLEVQ
jgi:hypothetical protein